MRSHHHCHINIHDRASNRNPGPVTVRMSKTHNTNECQQPRESSFRRFVNRSSSSSSSSIHILKVRHESRVESTNDHRKHSHCCSSLPTGTRTQDMALYESPKWNQLHRPEQNYPKNATNDTQTPHTTSKTVATMVMSTYTLQPPFHAQPSSLSY